MSKWTGDLSRLQKEVAQVGSSLESIAASLEGFNDQLSKPHAGEVLIRGREFEK